MEAAKKSEPQALDGLTVREQRSAADARAATQETSEPVPVTETTDSLTVGGCRRVSTTEQRESGAGLDAQREAIVSECDRRGWRLAAIFEDTAASGESLDGRLGLQAALDTLESQQASAIVVTKLDRLSRSLLDFAALMQRSRRRGWAIVALDLAVDTTSPSGEVMASVLAASPRTSGASWASGRGARSP